MRVYITMSVDREGDETIMSVFDNLGAAVAEIENGVDTDNIKNEAVERVGSVVMHHFLGKPDEREIARIESYEVASEPDN